MDCRLRVAVLRQIDAIHGRQGKPVFAYTIALLPDAADPDPPGPGRPVAPARPHPARHRRAAWIAGSLSWAYRMIDATMFPGDGLSAQAAQAAQAVLAREYATFRSAVVDNRPRRSISPQARLISSVA